MDLEAGRAGRARRRAIGRVRPGRRRSDRAVGEAGARRRRAARRRRVVAGTVTALRRRRAVAGRGGTRRGRRRRTSSRAARPRCRWASRTGSAARTGSPGGGLRRSGRRARDDVERPAVGVDVRERRQQLLRVRVARRAEDLVDGALLGDPAGVHDHDPVAGLGDHRQVVGDQDQRQAELRARSCSSSSRICAWTITSRAVVGSSPMTIAGSQARAIAIIARWRIPPDSSCG